MGTQPSNPDAIVIGSGPNGLAAAIEIARAGRSVLVIEAEETIGGGARSAELTLAGFTHDTCSAIHPLAVASPLFRQLPLSQYGLQWIEPPIALAHPFEDGTAAILERSLDATARALGPDAHAYEALMTPLVKNWPRIEPAVLGPLGLPRHPFAQLQFARRAFQSAQGLTGKQFTTEAARSLFTGIAAHGVVPLDRPVTAAIGLVLGTLGHIVGWPLPQRGAQSITDALASHLKSLGGEIVPGSRVQSIDDLPPSRAILCDLSPRPFLKIAGHRLPPSYRRKLERFRYGPASFKIDWALDGPVPWRASACHQAGTLHLGGTFAEIARSEEDVWNGRVPEKPFVILSQPSRFDATRAPQNQHTLWGYCHVPNGSGADMTGPIEDQIERFAPGFRKLILARSVMPPKELERRNANYVGGDIGAGATDWRQLFARPTMRMYMTPVRGLYLCSASTPPGGGVHGMCGYHAAQLALRRELR